MLLAFLLDITLPDLFAKLENKTQSKAFLVKFVLCLFILPNAILIGFTYNCCEIC